MRELAPARLKVAQPRGMSGRLRHWWSQAGSGSSGKWLLPVPEAPVMTRFSAPADPFQGDQGVLGGRTQRMSSSSSSGMAGGPGKDMEVPFSWVTHGQQRSVGDGLGHWPRACRPRPGSPLLTLASRRMTAARQGTPPWYRECSGRKDASLNDRDVTGCQWNACRVCAGVRLGQRGASLLSRPRSSCPTVAREAVRASANKGDATDAAASGRPAQA